MSKKLSVDNDKRDLTFDDESEDIMKSGFHKNNSQISLYVQRRVRVDVGHVFGVKTNPYLTIKYTFEIFHQPAVNYNVFSFKKLTS